MASVKLTRDLIRTIEPRASAYDLRDTEVPGFILRVNPSGRMTFVVQYARGKRVTLGRADSLPPADARDMARAIIADYARGIDPAEERKKAKMPTFNEFLDDTYGPWLKEHRKSGEATLRMLKSSFSVDLGTMPLDEINAFAVERWRTKRLKAGTARASLNRYTNALGAALTRAFDWGIIPSQPLRGRLKPLKIDSKPKVRYLTDDEEQRLRDALAARDEGMRTQRASANRWRATRGYDPLPDLADTYGDHLTPAVLLAINTGLRRAELFGLMWENVDLNGAMLTVVNTKSGHTRYVPLNAEALETLRRWQRWPRHQGPSKYVFPALEGDKPMRDTRSSWAKLLDDAGITDFRWHDMRHHFASRLVMEGVDLNTVRELLGHGDLQMTLRYAHLAPYVTAEAVARLDRRAV